MTPGAPELLAWEDFHAELSSTWRQGEHFTLVGPTGQGKTTFALGVLDVRSYVVALATKPRDATMTKLARSPGWQQIKAWERRPPIYGDKGKRLILWPPFREPEDQARQAVELDRAIRAMFVEGSWTIFADELFYLCRQLGLTHLLEMLWTQGRSVGVSVVGGTQRPAHVPLLAYDQATHLAFWRDNDETNLKRISGLGVESNAIRRVVANLPRYDALYLNTRTGRMIQTRAPRA